MKVRSHPLRPRRAGALAVPMVAVGAVLSALAMVAAPRPAQAQHSSPVPSSGPASSPSAAPGCILVEVHNVRPDQGSLMVAAYEAEATFRKTPTVATQMRAGAPTLSFPLCGLTAPAVALTLYQDVNGNGKLDSNAFGLPTEPWGASGKPVAMSAPTWNTAAVPVDGATVVVKLTQ